MSCCEVEKAVHVFEGRVYAAVREAPHEVEGSPGGLHMFDGSDERVIFEERPVLDGVRYP